MDRFLGVIFAAAKVLISFLLSFMVVIITLLVVLRGITGYSIKWAEEISLLCLMWVTFLSLGIGIRDDIHIRIGMFVTWLPARAKIVLEYFLNLVLLFISVMMVYYGGILTKFAMLHSLPATRLPSAVNYVVIPIVGILCSAQLIMRLLKGPDSKAWNSFLNGIEHAEETEGAK